MHENNPHPSSSPQTPDLATFFLSLAANRGILLKSILFTMLVAGGYFIVVKPSYEARATIAMAQVQSASTLEQNGRTDIESPQLVMEWLKFPSSYPPSVLQDCAVTGEDDPPEHLSKQLKLTLIPGLNSTLGLSVRRPSPAIAKQCLASIIALTSSHQNELLKARKEEIRQVISSLKAQQSETQQFIFSNDVGAAAATAYLARRDLLVTRNQATSRLEMALTNSSATKLVAPIYVTPEAVSPIWWQVALNGLFAGSFLGISSLVIRDLVSQIKKRKNK